MKSSEANIWSSIQHLKDKLHTDKMHLQNIRSQLHRSKTPLTKHKKENSNKENDSYISNGSQFRSSMGGNKQHELEMKRQHRKEISDMGKSYEDKLRKMAENHQMDIYKLKDHYESIIIEKNNYIQLLENAIPEQNESQPETPRTARLNEIHEIKEHYQKIIRSQKNKLQQLIDALSQQNNEIKCQLAEFKNITFKKPDTLLNHARQTLTKYMHSSDVSGSEIDLFSTSHIDYDSNNSQNQNHLKSSIIDNSQRLSSIFRNKFKFNKNEMIRHGSSVQINMDDYQTNWNQRSIFDQNPLPTIKQRQFRRINNDQNN